MNFCYIDEGWSLSSFETYLAQYRGLLASLPAYRVVYVAAAPGLWRGAQAVFERARRPTQSSITGAVASDLLRYFRMRRKWEARDFAGIEKNDIVRYRVQKRDYAGADYDALYGQWLAEGDAVVLPRDDASAPSPSPAVVQFETYHLDHNYELFGTI